MLLYWWVADPCVDCTPVPYSFIWSTSTHFEVVYGIPIPVASESFSRQIESGSGSGWT